MPKYSAAVITVSDTRTKENDLSGQAAIEILKDNNFEIIDYMIVIDDLESIKENLKDFSDRSNLDLVLTCGGTGFGSRDVTPEATLSVIEKQVPGFSELIRFQGAMHTKKAYLSRAISGIRKKTLIINLPGSPKGVKESLSIVVDLFGHAIEMIHDCGH